MCPLLKIESRFCTQVLRHSIMLSSVTLFGQVSMMSPAFSNFLLLDMDISINGRQSDITLYRSERWTERSLNIAKRCLQLRQLWCHLHKKNDFFVNCSEYDAFPPIPVTPEKARAEAELWKGFRSIARCTLSLTLPSAPCRSSQCKLHSGHSGW